MFSRLVTLILFAVFALPAAAQTSNSINDVAHRPAKNSALAELHSGDLIAVFAHRVSGDVLYGQRLTASGQKIGNNFEIHNNNGVANQVTPSVTSLVNGNFVVVWQSLRRSSDSEIWYRVFDSNANPVTTAKPVAKSNAGQFHPFVVALSNKTSSPKTDEGFVVTYATNGYIRSTIWATGFHSDGALKNSPIQVANNVPTTIADYATVPLNDGGFFTVWQHDRDAFLGSATGGIDLNFTSGRAYKSDFTQGITLGTPNNAPLVMPAPGSMLKLKKPFLGYFAARHISIAQLQDGTMLMARAMMGGYSKSGRKKVKRIELTKFDPTTGKEIRPRLKVLKSSAKNPVHAPFVKPQIAVLSNGDVLVSWQVKENSSVEIWSQRYTPNGSVGGLNKVGSPSQVTGQAKSELQDARRSHKTIALKNGAYVHTWSQLSGQRTSDALVSVYSANRLAKGKPNIHGTVMDSKTLSVSVGTVSDQDGLPWSAASAFASAATIQWYADGKAISGATQSSYTLTQNEVGKKVSASVRFKDNAGFDETVTSDETVPVVDLSHPATGHPDITGAVEQNVKLEAKKGTIVDLDGIASVLTFAWWSYDQNTVTGANSSNSRLLSTSRSPNYTLTQADVGKWIEVRVSFTDKGGAAEERRSLLVGPVKDVNDVPIGTVHISGKAIYDPATTTTLTVTSRLSDPDGPKKLAITYHWFRETSAGVWDPIQFASGANAIGTTYETSLNDVGKSIRVEARYKDGGGFDEKAPSDPTAKVNQPATGKPVISVTPPKTGTPFAKPQERETLFADVSGISDPSMPSPIPLNFFHYTWKRNGIDVASGQGLDTYPLTQADVRHEINVIVSFTDTLQNNETVVSDPVGPIENYNDQPNPKGKILGSKIRVGSRLTVDPPKDQDGISKPFTYRWQYVDPVSGTKTDIPGQSSDAELVLRPNSAGKQIQVIVSYTDDFKNNHFVTLGPTKVVEAIKGFVAKDLSGRVDSHATKNKTNPEISKLHNGGGHLIIWQTHNPAGPASADKDIGIAGQFFDVDGKRQYSEFLVNTQDTRFSQTLPETTHLSTGGAMVTFRPSQSIPVLTGQKYNASGSVLDTPQSLGLSNATPINGYGLTTLKDGNIMTVYPGPISNFSPPNIPWQKLQVVLFDPTTNTVSLPQAFDGANTNSTSQIPSVTAMSDGTALVAWHSGQKNLFDQGEDGVYVQRVSASGTPIGARIKVGDTTPGYLSEPDIVELRGGGWAITWQIKAGNQSALRIRFYHKNDQAKGGSQPVPTNSQSNIHADIADLPDGGAIVVWQSQPSPSFASGVFLQKFDFNGKPQGNVTRVSESNSAPLNGFEIVGRPDVEILDDDEGMVIAWAQKDNLGKGDSQIRARHYGPWEGNSDATGQVKINGGPHAVGKVLTARKVNIQDADGYTSPGVDTWQWYRDGLPIAGANSDAYTIQQADEQATISVRLSFLDDKKVRETIRSSNVIRPAPKQNMPATANLSITGPFELGAGLQGHVTNLADADGPPSSALTWHWYKDGVKLPGPNTFIPSWQQVPNTSANIGAQYHFEITFLDGAGNAERLVSDLSPPISGPRVFQSVGGTDTPTRIADDATIIAGQRAWPSIAALTDGGFVVSGTSSHAPPLLKSYYELNRFDAAGGNSGSPDISFPGVTFFWGQFGETRNSVVGLNSGGFAFAYEMGHMFDRHVVVRAYDSASHQIGSNPSYTTKPSTFAQFDPQLSPFPDKSGFAGIWSSYLQDGDGHGSYFKKFRTNGTALDFFDIQPYRNSAGGQLEARIAMLNNDSFAAVWLNGSKLYYRVKPVPTWFNTQFGNERQVRTFTNADASEPDIARLSSGKFVIVWVEKNPGRARGGTVYAQVYHSNGAAATTSPIAVTNSGELNDRPKVLGLVEGGFVITYAGLGRDANPYGSDQASVYTKFYDDNSKVILGEARVNHTVDGDQDEPSIAQLNDGSIIVAWHQNEGNTAPHGVYFTMLAQNTTATGSPDINPTVIAGTMTDLTAVVPASIADPDGLPSSNSAYSFQWKRNGKPIQNADKQAYKLQAADRGKSITVLVSFSDNNGNFERVAAKSVGVP